MYRLLDHTADMAMEVTAKTRTSLYKEAAAALVELACGPVKNRLPGGALINLQIKGSDEIDLLINWLREILALINTEGRVPVRIEVDNLGPSDLGACLELVPLDRAGGIISEIKAVTYHRAVVEQSGGMWRARVIFDT